MPFLGGSFPCSVAAQADIIRLNAHVVSRVFSVSLSSGRPSNVTNSPKRGQQRRTLVDNSTSWRAPSPSLPSSLLTKQRKVQSGRSAPPLSSNVSNVDANVEDLKISKTRQSKAFFFRFDAPTSRTLKLNSSPSLASSSMPPLRESGAPLIHLLCHATCKWARRPTRGWPGAGGVQLLQVRLCAVQCRSTWHCTYGRCGDLPLNFACSLRHAMRQTGAIRSQALLISTQLFFFFFAVFGKSYARGWRETKKIITVA